MQRQHKLRAIYKKKSFSSLDPSTFCSHFPSIVDLQTIYFLPENFVSLTNYKQKQNSKRRQVNQKRKQKGKCAIQSFLFSSCSSVLVSWTQFFRIPFHSSFYLLQFRSSLKHDSPFFFNDKSSLGRISLLLSSLKRRLFNFFFFLLRFGWKDYSFYAIVFSPYSMHARNHIAPVTRSETTNPWSNFHVRFKFSTQSFVTHSFFA